jgi:uncharacterized membrane protein
LSELVVVAFRDQYRAAEVLNELRRRDWDWVRDLADAVAVTLDGNGGVRIQLNVDLLPGGTARRIGLWRSLLSTTLFRPTPRALAASKSQTPDSAAGNGGPPPQSAWVPYDPAWWKEDFRLSEAFLRDVGAVVKPETSAIFVLLHCEQIFPVLRQLHNYGNMIIHTTLTAEQDEKLGAVLALA